jgi:hypothetical protein
MKCSSLDARGYFLLGMRVFFGIWILYGGLVKWVMFGASPFVAMICTDFDKTWSPHALNVVLSWIILIGEPLLGVWLLSGKCQRSAWTAGTLLMFMLTLGQTILMKPDVIANWQFTVLTLVCAALSPAKTETAAA